MKKSLADEERELVEEISKTRKVYIDSIKTSKRLMRRLLDGIVSGFGIAIGGTVVFGIAIYVITKIVLPLLPTWLANLTS
jgi:lipopolysaccharide/colanic/teichoic acid biosynthesis glycosyltransferase